MIALNVFIRAARRPGAREEGQSLIEAAVFLFVTFLLGAYSVDTAYLMMAYANVNSAARAAAEYSAMGEMSFSGVGLPPAGPVGSLTSVMTEAMDNLQNLAGSSTNVTIQVCSPSVGVTGTISQCMTQGPGSANPTADYADPEPTLYSLNQVNIQYIYQPPIPLSFFKVNFFPTPVISDTVYVRALN